MFKFWNEFWYKFANDKAFFVGTIRSAVMTISLNGIVFGHDLADALGMPGIEKPIKVMAVLCGGLAMFMRAGQMNEQAAPEVPPKLDRG